MFGGRGSTVAHVGVFKYSTGSLSRRQIGVLASAALVFGALFGASSSAQAEGTGKLSKLRPAWSRNYQVSGRAALNRQPNLTYLSNRTRTRNLSSMTDPLSEQLETLFEPGQAASWRKRYEAMNESYERRRNAGLGSATDDASYQGSLVSFRNDVQEETKKYQLRRGEVIGTSVVKRHPYTQPLLIPGIILTGVYIGRPVNLRFTDESRFTFRTSIRDRLGQIELHSPFIYGSLEVHPEANDRYTLWGNSGVDFGKAMDFNHVVDFEGERYQFKLARSLPFVDLNSFVLYGSSSNTVTGSVSRQLTPSLSAAVDSVYYLTPYAADHTSEERVRLKYSINF
jgi:hypothetical protein